LKNITFKYIIELMKTCNLQMFYFNFVSQVCSNIFTQLYSNTFFIDFYDIFYFSNFKFTFLWGQYMHARFCTIIRGVLNYFHTYMWMSNDLIIKLDYFFGPLFHPMYIFTTWSKMIMTLDLTKLLELCNFASFNKNAKWL
jgi:hypothetical protein